MTIKKVQGQFNLLISELKVCWLKNFQSKTLVKSNIWSFHESQNEVKKCTALKAYNTFQKCLNHWIQYISDHWALYTLTTNSYQCPTLQYIIKD